jgi:hypothetical protein
MLRFVPVYLGVFLCAASLRADFSYQESTKITGGALAQATRVMGVFSKQLREPIQTTVLLKGDRMAHVTRDSIQIIDLAAETFTSVNTSDKTYSVLTFAEMQQAIESMAQKMQESKQGELNFKVKVEPTSQTKQIAGLDAKLVMMTIEIEGQDQKTGDKGAMTVSTESWVAPKSAGYAEVTAFMQRMAQKLAWSPRGGGLMGARPDMAKAMAEVAKETAKLDGMPVMQVIRMGARAEASGAAGSAAKPQQAPPPPQDQTAQQPSRGGRFGRLGGLTGGLGGLGRRKADEPQAADAASGSDQSASGVLMEMTTESSNFSTAPVDASKLEVPAGFKKVESPMLKQSR